MSIPTQEMSARALAAFHEYCALGPMRSLSKLTDVLRSQYTGKRETLLRQLEKWSSVYHWKQLARAYDIEQAEALERDRLRRKTMRAAKREKERDQMDDDHTIIGKSMAMLMTQQVQAFIKDGKWTPAATVGMFKASTDLQRAAMGADRPEDELTGAPTPAIRIIIETDNRPVDTRAFEPQSMQRFLPPAPLSPEEYIDALPGHAPPDPVDGEESDEETTATVTLTTDDDDEVGWT